MQRKFSIFGLTLFLFLFSSKGWVFADQTAVLLPISAGAYSQWTTSTGSIHWSLVDEAVCNGTGDYNRTTVVGQRDSYGVSLSSVPEGSTITSISITPCASRQSSGGANPVANVFYRLNGVNSADLGAYSLTGTTPTNLASTSFNGLSVVKSPTTSLESGMVLTSSTKGARLSRIGTVVTYTPLVAPTGLSGSAPSHTQVDLVWSDNSSNESGFRVERSLDGVNSWTLIGTQSANVTTFSDTGLAASTTYYYRVSTFNTGGSTTYSNTTSVTTLPNPINIPTSLVANANSQTKITLTWVDNATNETGYKIEQSLNGVSGWVNVVDRGPNANFQQIFNLTPNTTYYFRVYAINGGGQSDYSNVASATTPYGAPIVTTLDATNIINTGSVSATLNSSINSNLGDTTFVYRYGTSNVACDQLPFVSLSGFIVAGISTISPNAKNITSLIGSSTYYFCAVGTNATGTTYGNVLSFITP